MWNFSYYKLWPHYVRSHYNICKMKVAYFMDVFPPTGGPKNKTCDSNSKWWITVFLKVRSYMSDKWIPGMWESGKHRVIKKIWYNTDLLKNRFINKFMVINTWVYFLTETLILIPFHTRILRLFICYWISVMMKQVLQSS